MLREGMYRKISESMRNRLDKMGFPAPARDWFPNGLYGRMQDFLGSKDVRGGGIYNLEKKIWNNTNKKNQCNTAAIHLGQA